MSEDFVTWYISYSVLTEFRCTKLLRWKVLQRFYYFHPLVHVPTNNFHFTPLKLIPQISNELITTFLYMSFRSNCCHLFIVAVQKYISPI